jgi:amidohydrolase family protein
VELLQTNPRLRSESYLALLNGTSGYCLDGAPASNVTRTCLRTGGFEPTEAGLEQAILAGWAQVNDQRGDEMALLVGEAGRELWRELGTRADLCFAINNPVSQFLLAVARRRDGRFAVDALSTDGGGIPRNETVARGLALVHFGALSLADFVRKACWAPARMLGLFDKGHLGVGADADVALIDPRTRQVKATFAGGQPVALDGVVVGRGGTVITTAAGERAVRSAGLASRVVDLRRAGFYDPAMLDG